MQSASGMQMKDKSFVVSVIIVNWNAKDLLRNCIISIMQQTRCSFEIIVIDNASSDGSAAMVQSEFSDVVLIANRDNRGFAAANNQGILIAKGQYVLLLNPDTIILDGAIDTMIEWLDRREDVGCAGCQVLEDAETIQKTCFADPNPLNLTLIETGLHYLINKIGISGPLYANWDRMSAREVDVVSGMFILMRRSVVEIVGLLDEQFFIYAEEADYCKRIRAIGFRCVFTPHSRIIHLDGGSKSTKLVKPRMYLQLQKSMLLYTLKHHGFFWYIYVKIIFILSQASRWILFTLITKFFDTPGSANKANLSKIVLNYHILGRDIDNA